MERRLRTAAASNSIVCGIDHNEHADAIAKFAAGLGRRLDTGVLLLNVLAKPAVSERPYATFDERRHEAEEFERAGQLQVVFGEVGAAGEPGVSTAVEFGQPAEVLAAAAESLEAPFLVVGDQELTGLDRLVLGSTAVEVIGKSPCPVLVHPSAPVTPSGGPLVCGIDRSAAGLEVARVAARLAEQLQLGLVLVSALGGAFDEEPSFELELQAARDHLPAESTELIAERSSPVELLSRISRDRDAEMIVVGSRGHGAFRRALLGSVSTALLKETDDRPVVVVPSGVGEDAAD